MKYLGIILKSELNKIVEHKYASSSAKNTWTRGSCEILVYGGKCFQLKQMVVPKLNYKSMMLPTCIASYIFKQCNGIVKILYGQEKKHASVCRKSIPLKKDKGLPDVKLYNVAFELSRMAKH
jgi:hypothetical protein